MDLKAFSTYANDPKRTRSELEQMKVNVVAKGELEAARMVDDVLLRRFPTRGRTGGGKTPTEASFKGRSETFESGKDAYLWLVDQFRANRSNALQAYVELTKRRGSERHGSRFATTPSGLFPPGSKRAGDPKYYSALASGWFADTNINHDDKFATLLKLSYVCDVEYQTEWEFRPIGSTERLREHQKAVIHGRELLAELLADIAREA